MFDKDLSHGNQELVTRDFLKKYLSFMKSQAAPELTDDVLGYTANLYAALRKKAAHFDQNKISQPVTVRTCETLIRLATAHSKLRFSKRVETTDVDVAISMLKETIFNEQIDRKEAENVEMSDDIREEENNYKPSVPRQATNLRALKAEAKPSGPEPGKKSKVDADEQVTQLFNAQPTTQPLADVAQKKIIFKIANAIKDS